MIASGRLHDLASREDHRARAENSHQSDSSSADYRSVPAGIVEGKVGEGTLNLPADFQFARALTTRAAARQMLPQYVWPR